MVFSVFVSVSAFFLNKQITKKNHDHGYHEPLMHSTLSTNDWLVIAYQILLSLFPCFVRFNFNLHTN